MLKQEIIDKKFSRAFQGYDIAEVDYFLDELYRELSFRDREEAALQTQIEEMRDEMEMLRSKLPAESTVDAYGEEDGELCFLEESAGEDGEMHDDGYDPEAEEVVAGNTSEVQHTGL